MAHELVFLFGCFVLGANAGNAVFDAEHRQWRAFAVDIAGVVVAGMAVMGR